MDETLTIQQAFAAMVFFLEDYYQRTQSDEVAVLLGSLNMNLWADHMTGDPAAWDDWIASVQKVLLPDTPANRQRLQDLISYQENYQGTDTNGNQWYAQILPDGKQFWAKVRNGDLKYGGMRQTPQAFHPKKGLSSLPEP